MTTFDDADAFKARTIAHLTIERDRERETVALLRAQLDACCNDANRAPHMVGILIVALVMLAVGIASGFAIGKKAGSVETLHALEGNP